MRVLGVDYGTRNIGVAVSDALGLGARGVTTLRDMRAEDAVAALVGLASELEVEAVVVGLPLDEAGGDNDASRRVRGFVGRLSLALAVPVHTVGERLTSFEAEERMREMGIRGAERRRRIDEVAATIIVEQFLASRMKEDSTW